MSELGCRLVSQMTTDNIFVYKAFIIAAILCERYARFLDCQQFYNMLALV